MSRIKDACKDMRASELPDVDGGFSNHLPLPVLYEDGGYGTEIRTIRP